MCTSMYVCIYTYIKSPIYLWDLYVNKKNKQKIQAKQTHRFLEVKYNQNYLNTIKSTF